MSKKYLAAHKIFFIPGLLLIAYVSLALIITAVINPALIPAVQTNWEKLKVICYFLFALYFLYQIYSYLRNRPPAEQVIKLVILLVLGIGLVTYSYYFGNLIYSFLKPFFNYS